jgi:hypothetical protein
VGSEKEKRNDQGMTGTMRNVSKAREPASRVVEIRPPRDDVLDRAALAAAAGQPDAYAELPDDGAKWPKAFRVAFIAAAAAVLWGAILYLLFR